MKRWIGIDEWVDGLIGMDSWMDGYERMDGQMGRKMFEWMDRGNQIDGFDEIPVNTKQPLHGMCLRQTCNTLVQ